MPGSELSSDELFRMTLDQAKRGDQADADGGDEREKSRSGPVGRAQAEPIGFDGQYMRSREDQSFINACQKSMISLCFTMVSDES